LVQRPIGIPKRRLQQNLHRHRAKELNHALSNLIAFRLIARDADGMLALPPAVHDTLRQLGFGVSRPPAVRAWRVGRARPATKTQRLAWLRSYLRPAVGTPEWGKWMLAKRGGYARQRQCRAFGINPWEAGTRRRLELKHLRE
jgi:hypothetical protein